VTWTSKSGKNHQSLLLETRTFEKRKLHEEKGTYICQVSIHAYWSWCITLFIDRLVSHRHLFLSELLKPQLSQQVRFIALPFSLWVRLRALHHLRFCALQPTLSARLSPHPSGSVFSNPASFRVCLRALDHLRWCVF